jgi:hypothetical protein
MKKTYQQPSMEMDNMETESVICSSQSITSDGGITYGGVDETGSKDPASRRNCSIWDDDMEDE